MGELSLDPLYVTSGRNTPVNFRITLPVTLQRDRISVSKGSLATSVSTVTIDAAMENMKDPKITAHLNGRIATIDLENLANLPLAVIRKMCLAN